MPPSSRRPVRTIPNSSPEAGQRVALLSRETEALTRGAQELVARLVAERVVERPETVDVHQENGDRMFSPDSFQHGLFETIGEEHPGSAGRSGRRSRRGARGAPRPACGS